MQHFAVCSNPKCNYSTTFPGSAALQFALNHPKAAAETLKGIDSVLPKARRCELCGATLLFFCPRCKKELFTSPDAKYCRSCGKEIKPEAGIDGDRRKLNTPFKGAGRRRGIDRRLGERPRDPE
jgi:hypothetical protein